MAELWEKYKEFLFYVIFGVLTTLVNIVVYGVMYGVGFSNMSATVAAWVLSVLFAYITNKLFVFGSRTFATKVLVTEMVSFFLCRLATGIMDMAIMYIFVDMDILNMMTFQLNPKLGNIELTVGFHMIVKILSNVLVIILNYVASKLIIFKKSK